GGGGVHRPVPDALGMDDGDGSVVTREQTAGLSHQDVLVGESVSHECPNERAVGRVGAACAASRATAHEQVVAIGRRTVPCRGRQRCLASGDRALSEVDGRWIDLLPVPVTGHSTHPGPRVGEVVVTDRMQPYLTYPV